MRNLEEGQQTGQTARQLYGTPTEPYVAVILEQQLPSDDEGTLSWLEDCLDGISYY